MSYTDWLRGQVQRLEGEIRAHTVFDTDDPATPAQLKELRSKIVVHTYLKQQLLRREAVRPQIPRVEDPIEVELDLDVPPVPERTPVEPDEDFDTHELEFITREAKLPEAVAVRRQ